MSIAVSHTSQVIWWPDRPVPRMGDIGDKPRRIEVLPATKPVRQPQPAPSQPAPAKTPAKEPVPA